MNSSKAEPEGFRLTTGSRLHFGLYSFAPPQADVSDRPDRTLAHATGTSSSTAEAPATWFGGVGLMVSQPETSVQFFAAPELGISGDPTGRVTEFVQRWYAYICERCPQRFGDLAGPQELPVTIVVDHLPPPHHGLGAGTQLALTIGQGLARYFLSTDLSAEELARSVGRGLRSAIGTHGFLRGGLIVDRGKTRPENLGILDGAFDLPPDWRVVLLLSPDRSGLHGAGEIRAFQSLPPIPASTTLKLQTLTRQQLIPALTQQDFGQFSAAIYEYGLEAGLCFSQVQGGPFASARAQAWVDQLRSWGLPGVGQSSWGPTLFCFAADESQADWVAQRMQQHLDPRTEQVMVARAQVGGFQISPLDTHEPVRGSLPHQ